jgi:hypothetical protein
LGDEFRVSSITTNTQQRSSVAADAQGNFVVVWESFGSYGTDTSGESIQGQRYDDAGNAVGSNFQINSYTTSSQRSPSVAQEADGSFVVIWNSWGSYSTDKSQSSIQAQRYDSGGAALGGQYQVNSYTTNYQGGEAVTIDAQGNFVVVWRSYEGSYSTDTSSFSIQGQRFATPFFADGFESGDASAWSSTVQ